MDCCHSEGLLPFEDACEQLLASVSCNLDSEEVPLASALDRILATDIRASVQVPSSDNSAMDGYAFHATDLDNNTHLHLVGQSLAGHPYRGLIRRGECIRIMTGAVIPEGADTVEMQENTYVSDDIVYFTKVVKQGQHIRHGGEDVKQGDTILRAGHRLSTLDFGLLAAQGITHLQVYKPLSISVFSSGDELRNPGESLTDGNIYDSNRFSILAILTKLGFNVIDLGVIKDTEQAIEDTFMGAAENSDVIISSGGVSVGDADYIKSVLKKIGTVNLWKVAIKPGKPFVFGHIKKRSETPSPQPVFFGLPGNPVSAVVTLDQLAIPALRKLAGENHIERLQFKVPLAHDLKRQSGRTEFLRGRLNTDFQGDITVSAHSSQGSGVLSSFTESNGYIVVPSEKGQLQAGEMVTFQPYASVLR